MDTEQKNGLKSTRLQRKKVSYISFGINGLYNNKYKTFIMLLILLRPEIINNYPTVDYVFNLLRIVVAIIVVFDYFLIHRFSKLFIAQMAMWTLYVIHCIVNRTYEYHVLVTILIILTLNAMVESCIYKKNETQLFKGLRMMLILYLIANTISILLGYNESRLFLGFDNDFAMILIPLEGVLLYGGKLPNGKYNKIDIVIVLISFFNFLITRSASGILAFFVLSLYACFGSKCLKLKGWHIFLIFIALWSLTYFLQIQRLFSFFIVEVLGKDVTLSYRTEIWSTVVEAIKEKWLIGYGNYSNNLDYLSHFRYMTAAPHNVFLYYAVTSGLVGVFIRGLIVAMAFKKIDKSPTKRNAILIVALFCYFLCGTVASYYAEESFSFLLCVAFQEKGDKKVLRTRRA